MSENEIRPDAMSQRLANQVFVLVSCGVVLRAAGRDYGDDYQRTKDQLLDLVLFCLMNENLLSSRETIQLAGAAVSHKSNNLLISLKFNCRARSRNVSDSGRS